MMRINDLYDLKVTADGSPTLVYKTGEDHLWIEEKMHSEMGAASETEYIYGPAIRFAFDQIQAPRILIVGLGIGYIEFLSARESLSRGKPLEMHSFETSSFLKNGILDWLFDSPTDLKPVLDRAIGSICLHNAEDSKEVLRKAYEAGSWKISGDVSNLRLIREQSHAICYDLFSSRIESILWSEEFLNQFLTIAAKPDCAFATYASKGSLKKALKKHDFRTELKAGFGKKRESTFAWRELSRPT